MSSKNTVGGAVQVQTRFQSACLLACLRARLVRCQCGRERLVNLPPPITTKQMSASATRLFLSADGGVRSFLAGLTMLRPRLCVCFLASTASSPSASTFSLDARMRGLPAFSRALAANWAFFARMSLNVGCKHPHQQPNIQRQPPRQLGELGMPCEPGARPAATAGALTMMNIVSPRRLRWIDANWKVDLMKRTERIQCRSRRAAIVMVREDRGEQPLPPHFWGFLPAPPFPPILPAKRPRRPSLARFGARVTPIWAESGPKFRAALAHDQRISQTAAALGQALSAPSPARNTLCSSTAGTRRWDCNHVDAAMK